MKATIVTSFLVSIMVTAGGIAMSIFWDMIMMLLRSAR